jgi:hypothetical protein
MTLFSSVSMPCWKIYARATLWSPSSLRKSQRRHQLLLAQIAQSSTDALSSSERVTGGPHLGRLVNIRRPLAPQRALQTLSTQRYQQDDQKHPNYQPKEDRIESHLSRAPCSWLATIPHNT